MSHTIRRRASYPLLRLHERNYALLVRLIPHLRAEVDQGVSHIAGGSALHFKVLERSKYTCTIALTKYISMGELDLPYPDLHIRVYHDAQVAEIHRRTGRSGRRWFELEFDPAKVQAEGQEQMNRFFNIVLSRWLGQGHVFQLTGAGSSAASLPDCMPT